MNVRSGVVVDVNVNACESAIVHEHLADNVNGYLDGSVGYESKNCYEYVNDQKVNGLDHENGLHGSVNVRPASL